MHFLNLGNRDLFVRYKIGVLGVPPGWADEERYNLADSLGTKLLERLANGRIVLSPKIEVPGFRVIPPPVYRLWLSTGPILSIVRLAEAQFIRFVESLARLHWDVLRPDEQLAWRQVADADAWLTCWQSYAWGWDPQPFDPDDSGRTDPFAIWRGTHQWRRLNSTNALRFTYASVRREFVRLVGENELCLRDRWLAPFFIAYNRAIHEGLTQSLNALPEPGGKDRQHATEEQARRSAAVQLGAKAAPVCAACRGGCCRRENPLKFTKDDLELWKAARLSLPKPDPEQDRYGRCAFLGENGCRFPIGMRPLPCMRYHCSQTREVLDQAALIVQTRL